MRHPTSIASGAASRVARRCGASRRACSVIGAAAVRCSVLPLVHRRPKLAGWSGSPRTPVIWRPSDSMTTPQPTPQYGQVDFVSATAGDQAVACSAIELSSSTSSETVPFSTLTLKRGVQPSSGAFAQPLSRPIVQLCSGQATDSPKTMPWLRGRPCAGSGRAARKPCPRRCGTPRPRRRRRATRGARRGGDVLDAADGFPLAHHATPTVANWRVSTAALSNSNQGSGSPSSENCRRSQSD